jgi:hypothetical protein
MNKFIIKIQSFTDVITNSSSTVFVMNRANATYYKTLENTQGCVSMQPITAEWLKDNLYEFEMVCKFLHTSPSEFTIQYEDDEWEWPSVEDWQDFVNKHKHEINEVFKNLYYVEIEDHFEDAWDVIRNAMDDAEWYDCRH